ncbi:MAG: DUF2520 domain-containing protein [Eubacteriaceae bacterium]|nr:DUF2520 domain-containing protein [Eubacteriaceae bacterium]
MRTGFIGAGKAGTSLGAYFKDNGVPVAGYFSRSIESSKQAADLTKSTAFSDLKELVTESDMIFITTPDGAIGETAEKLADFDLAGKYLCHLSGSVSSGVLLCADERCASAHPMTAISGKNTDLSGVFFTLEGEEETMTELEQIFKKCGNPTARIRTEKKDIYHCAASVASNLMVGLAQISIDMLKECGFDEKSASELLAPLMKNNISAVCEKGTAAALTGPVERADADTVKKHLGCFEKTEGAGSGVGSQQMCEIYRLLSLELIDIAREKNKDRNYNELKELLEEKK